MDGVAARRNIDAVLFDAMGTLVALEAPAPRLRRELARLGARVGRGDAERAIAAEIAYYRAHLDEARDAATLRALRRRCAAVVRENLPVETRSQLSDLDRVAEALLASLQFSAYPDVLGALERLRARGVRLAVVSNWDASLPDVLARVGIASLLDGVLTSAQAGARKPSPEIFRMALAQVGAATARTLHVGDSLEEDVAGARAAGIEPLLLCRGETLAPDGVRAIRSLDEL